MWKTSCSSVLAGLLLAVSGDCRPSSADSRSDGGWRSFPSAGYATALAAGKSTLWIGGGGLWRYDLDRRQKRVYRSEGGLPSNGVTSLALDEPARELWIGTVDGLARFDYEAGRFHTVPLGGPRGEDTFATGEESAREWVLSVAVSRFRGRTTIWIGTRAGLDVLDRGSMKRRTFTAGDGLGDDWVNALAVDDARGVVWAGTAAGVRRYDLDAGRWDDAGTSPAPWVDDLVVDSRGGDLWRASSTSGLALFQAERGVWREALRDGTPVGARSLTLDEARDVLWVGTDDGLWSYDLARRAWRRPDGGDVTAAAVTAALADARHDAIWLATGDGVWGRDLGGGAWSAVTVGHPGPAHNDVNELVLDGRSDSLWLATDGGGVSRYDLGSGTWSAYTRADGLFSHDFRSADWNGLDRSLWLGTLRGAGVFRPAEKASRQLEGGLGGATVTAVAVDEVRRVAWLGAWGSDGGLCRYSLDGDEKSCLDRDDGLAHDSVTSIALDGPRVWVGTGGGLSRYDTTTGAWRTFTVEDGLPTDAVVRVAVDRKRQVVWVSTESGVAAYDERQDTWTRFPKSRDGPAHDVVLSIAIDEAQDTVWLGTEGHGVSRYRPRTGAWRTFTTRDGLASNYVLSIRVDPKRGCVWLGTLAGGASRFCPAAEEPP